MTLAIIIAIVISVVFGGVAVAVAVNKSRAAANAEARRVAVDTTRHVIAREVWPHPLVGRTVAYKNNPTTPIGDVVHVDGSRRARIRRLASNTLVRRSLDRIVEVAN